MSRVQAVTLRSEELARHRRELSAQELLRESYRGIPGREPDIAGARTYLPKVERGDLAGVALTPSSPEELEQRLDDATR